MTTAYFFSDENGQHSGGRYFVVAGVAFSKYRTWVEGEIQHAERVSGKGKRDWKEAKNVAQRVDYLSRVFKITHLRGAVFYAAYENHQKEYWDYTVDALSCAVQRLGSECHSIIRHQGFNSKTRDKLRAGLKAVGASCDIQSGDNKRCEVRLADALAGYIGLVRYSGSQAADWYPDVPDWFVNLKAPCHKNEAPIQA